ncbi:MAG: hypothetical protein JW850_17910, partial [Thermoflexales bacterium]|nr:hypothetical protein [Thermoflexales bacterium]
MRRSCEPAAAGGFGQPAAVLQSAAACQRGGSPARFTPGDAPAFDDGAALQRKPGPRRLGLV